VPLLTLVLCGLSSLLTTVCNVMPQGSCVKVRLSRLQCERTIVAEPVRAGDRRHPRVPDVA